MGTRPRKKQQHRLERWQLLLAAAVAAIASIAVALINLIPSGSPSAPSVDITGLVEQSFPPPPGRLYLWTGTVHDQPSGAEVFIIDKRPGEWLVSPAAVIAAGGAWTVTWAIPTPPASAQWIAVAYFQGSGACPAPGCPAAPSGSGLNQEPSSILGVIAVAPYQPRAAPATPRNTGTGNADAGQNAAYKITKRAIALGLETP